MIGFEQQALFVRTDGLSEFSNLAEQVASQAPVVGLGEFLADQPVQSLQRIEDTTFVAFTYRIGP